MTAIISVIAIGDAWGATGGMCFPPQISVTTVGCGAPAQPSPAEPEPELQSGSSRGSGGMISAPKMGHGDAAQPEPAPSSSRGGVVGVELCLLHCQPLLVVYGDSL